VWVSEWLYQNLKLNWKHFNRRLLCCCYRKRDDALLSSKQVWVNVNSSCRVVIFFLLLFLRLFDKVFSFFVHSRCSNSSMSAVSWSW
jgi:hypothetical protein